MTGPDGPLDADELDRLRFTADPTADAAYLAWMNTNPQPIDAGPSRLTFARLGPGDVDHLLGPYEPPAWRANDQVQGGADVWAEYGAYIGFALFVCSLPQGYLYPTPARALYVASELAVASPDQSHLSVLDRRPPAHGTVRRLQETARFLQVMLAPDALEPDGAGIRAARELRMLHAGMRHLILQDPDVLAATVRGMPLGPWPTEQVGPPICQFDLIGTLVTFATLPFELMRRLDVDITDDDEAAYTHLWSVIGHAMGVDPAALPLTPTIAENFLRRQRAQEQVGSPEAVVLAGHLVASMQHGLPRRLGHLPAEWIRYFSGDDVGDLLGLDRRRTRHTSISLMRGFSRASNLLRSRSRIARWASDRLVHTIIERFVAGAEVVRRAPIDVHAPAPRDANPDAGPSESAP